MKKSSKATRANRVERVVSSQKLSHETRQDLCDYVAKLRRGLTFDLPLTTARSIRRDIRLIEKFLQCQRD